MHEISPKDLTYKEQWPIKVPKAYLFKVIFNSNYKLQVVHLTNCNRVHMQ